MKLEGVNETNEQSTLNMHTSYHCNIHIPVHTYIHTTHILNLGVEYIACTVTMVLSTIIHIYVYYTSSNTYPLVYSFSAIVIASFADIFNFLDASFSSS